MSGRITRIRILAVACCGLLAPAMQSQQTKPKLTARELFYAAADAPAPVTPAVVKTDKPAAAPKPKARRKSTPASTGDAPAAASPDSTPVVKASYDSAAGPALGLRYSILKRQADSQTAEVDADTTFHAGDRIRLAVEANADGYLYVVNRGSSGTWKILFPAAEVQSGDNRIHKLAKYEIPSGYTFTFDEQAGEEKLFIVFSRQPEPNLEKLIYSLGSAKPVATPPAESQDSGRLLMASATVNDAMVGSLRNSYARDLIIEKMSDEHPGEKKEKAVYTVNPSASSDSRVVADVTLKHQ